MTFICPVCNELSSSKHEKFGKMKKGKNWRERSKERVKYAPAVGGSLAFFCPCCKERRQLSANNPFQEFNKHGHKNLWKEKEKEKKKRLKRLKSTITPRKPASRETTALTADGIAHELEFTPEDIDRAGFRVYRNSNAKVSWDDATEMRRLILKDILLHAALEPLLVIQCAARCWRARVRVKKIREAKNGKKKRRVRSSTSSVVSQDDAELKSAHK